MSMLVSLADMKTYLGVSGSGDDAFLTQQITVVSDSIEAYCRRIFGQATYVQTFYGTDYESSPYLKAFMFPIISVTSLVEDGITNDVDYRVNKPTGFLVRPTNLFHFGKTASVLTYVAGYATIPSIIQSVVYSIVQEQYNKKTAGVNVNFGSDVQRVSIPGTISIDFDYSLSNNDRSTPFGQVLGSYLNMLDAFRSDRSILGEGKLIYVA